MARFYRYLLLIPAFYPVVCAVAAAPNRQTIQPVGLIVTARGGQIQRKQDSLSIGLKMGDLLFAGDTIRLAATDEVRLAFCPTNADIQARGEAVVTFSERDFSFTRGRAVQRQPVPVCSLPDVFPDNQGGDKYVLSMARTLQRDTRPVGTFQSRLAALPPAARGAMESAKGPLDTAVARNATDILAVLARGTLFQRQGLDFDAAQDFERASNLLGKPAWLVFVQNRSEERDIQYVPSTPVRGGKTYAVVIGVSQFPNLPQKLQLQFADADAASFSRLLSLPRGGSLTEHVTLRTMLNDQAKKDSVLIALSSFLVGHATAQDTVILFVASHGALDGSKPYLLTSESSLQKLDSTAIHMEDLLGTLKSRESKAGKVLMFVDICHAAHVSDFRPSNDKDVRAGVGSLDNVFALAATRGGQDSIEAPDYGGGHGAFSYFLLRAMNTREAVPDRTSKTLFLDDLIEYVRQHVRQSTPNKQTPVEIGYLDPHLAIVNNVDDQVKIDLGEYPARAKLVASTRGIEPEFPPWVETFRNAIAAGHILPGDPQSAFDQLAELRRRFGEDRLGYLDEENELRSALEDAGQKVLLQYLKGDEVPQSSVDFEWGAKLFQAASTLTPESLELQSNALFCQGRALIFAHRYPEAMALLEEAARLTPAEAYVWNALGIGYLQMPDYGRAIAAFEDAIRRAPLWAYPRHNLALALRERGNLAGAIAQYQAAILHAPDYSYLRYNLGLLYQQINDRENAAKAYSEAWKLANREPARARILIAQALFEASRNRDAALQKLEDAATHQPDPGDRLILRYNRALILAEKPAGEAEAVRLWIENLQEKPDHLPSLIAMAQMLDRRGDRDGSIHLYRRILRFRPDYTAARLELARLAAVKDPQAALEILEKAPASTETEPRLEVLIGDLSAKNGDRAAAIAAYCAVYVSPGTALDLRAEVRRRLKMMQVRPESACQPPGAKRSSSRSR